MRYEKENKAFILTQDDLSALGMPAELSVWPETDIDHLVEEATFAQHRIDGLDTSYFPSGVTLAQIKAEKAKRSESLRAIRYQLARHETHGINTTEDLPEHFRPQSS